jgi:hypothetical protein
MTTVGVAAVVAAAAMITMMMTTVGVAAVVAAAAMIPMTMIN